MIFGVSDQLRVEGVSNPEGVQEELVRICREEIFPPIIPQIDSISFDNGRRLVVLDIDGKRRPYRTRDGRFYIRNGAEKREMRPRAFRLARRDSSAHLRKYTACGRDRKRFRRRFCEVLPMPSKTMCWGKYLSDFRVLEKGSCSWQSEIPTSFCRPLRAFCFSGKMKK